MIINHIILTIIVALLGVGLKHLLLWRAARRDRQPDLDIQRWEDDGGLCAAPSN